MKRTVSLCLIFFMALCSVSSSYGFANENNNDVNEAELQESLSKDSPIEPSVSSSVYSSDDELIVLPDNFNVVDNILSSINYNEKDLTEQKQRYLVRLKKNAKVINNDAKSLKSSKHNTISNEQDEFKSVKRLEKLNSMSVDLAPDQVNALIRNQWVEAIELDKPIEVLEVPSKTISPQEIRKSSQNIPWGIHSTGAYLVNSQKSSGETVKVAVFDTGISNHEDLSVTGAVYFDTTTERNSDDNGHGTHVAGIIAAVNNELGVMGMSNYAELYSVKVLNSNGTGYTSSVIEGIEWAIDNHIQIINMSFASSEYSGSLHEMIQLARDNGILIVASAGNAGAGEDNIQYPAKYPEVIAVGSINKDFKKSNFSSTGPELDLVAPGLNILSTMNNGGYGTFSGTSMSAAYVTGAAALLWSKNLDLSADDIINQLYSSATNLGTINEYGHGLINVAKALNLISGSIAPFPSDLYTGEAPTILPHYNGDIEIASYDRVGNLQEIEPGDSATVALKLQGDQNGNNIHEKIEISVHSTSGVILGPVTINNPQLHQAIPFTWNTTELTAPGYYSIQFHYPASPDYDDLFTIIVKEPGQDTYEPNGYYDTAYGVQPGNSYISYISSNIDIDFYSFTALQTGIIDLNMYVPSGSDFDLYAYDGNYQLKGSSTFSSSQPESIRLTVFQGSTYYIQVVGYSGTYSRNPYTLSLGNIGELILPAPTNLTATPGSDRIKLTWTTIPEAISYKVKIGEQVVGTTTESSYIFLGLEPQTTYTIGVAAVYPEGESSFSTIQATTKIDELLLDIPIDSQLASEKNRMFIFKPAVDGVYRIFTSPYQGSGTTYDTVLDVYSDSNLSQIIGHNDDFNGSKFSELDLSLVGGKTYYIKLSNYETGLIQFRIMATVLHSSIPYISVDQPVDIQEQAGSSTFYVFIPTVSGKYKFITTFFNGASFNGEHDTNLQLYTDSGMTQLFPGGNNDDSASSVFSELQVTLTKNVPYFIKVDSSDDSQVKARLLVTSLLQESFVPLQNRVSTEMSLPAGQQGLFSFTPGRSGNYRFFTSGGTNNSQMQDTVMKVFADPGLNTLLGENDDIPVGSKPYGEQYSKLEMDLVGNQTYYITVENYQPSPLFSKLWVEDNYQGTRDRAKTLIPGEEVLLDNFGSQPTLSSYYDQDYYQFDLTNQEQISVNLSTGIGTILDVNNNIIGHASPGIHNVFTLAPGHYYIKIQYSLFNSAQTSSNFQGEQYVLGFDINEITFGHDSAEVSALNLYENAGSFNATYGEQDYAQFTYKNKVNSTSMIMEVMTTYGNKVYKTKFNGTYTKGYSSYFKWNGQITENFNFYGVLANDGIPDNLRNSYNIPRNYYAKDGLYDVIIYPEGTSKKTWYRVEVSNNPLNRMNWIPIPPKYMGKTKITGKNKDKCPVCENYFYQYVLSPNDPIPLNAYDVWATDMYGPSGLQKFWRGMERFVYNPNLDAADNLQNLIGNIGMIPVLGEPADGLNGVIYLLRGNQLDAATSLASMIPLAGNGVAGLKTFRTIEKLDDATDYLKHYEDLPTTAPVKKGVRESTILRGEMIKAKIPIPPLTNGITRWDAHHILPAGKNNERMVELQNKFKNEFDIDINSPANGMFLPVKKGQQAIELDLDNAYIAFRTHNKLHSKKYYDYVNDMLSGAQTREEAIFKLKEIRKALISKGPDIEFGYIK